MQLNTIAFDATAGKKLSTIIYRLPISLKKIEIYQFN